MRPLVVIPARGESKGVPGKNIKLLGGKPLLHYTIEAALQVFPPETICISTDSPEIKACAEQTGLRVPFLRPSELATDHAGMREVLLHAVNFYESHNYNPDTVILLQPTSPFRTAQHIREAMALYSDELDMVVSVKESKANPYFNLFEESEDGNLLISKKAGFIRRQDCPPVWQYNGALYVINAESLNKQQFSELAKVKKYIMNEKASIDIDSVLDWVVAEAFCNIV